MRTLVLALTGLLLVSVPAVAQTPQSQRPATLRVVVHDPTDLPIEGANVALRAADGSTRRATTNSRGEASFENLRPSIYSGRVESVGFSPLPIEPFSIGSGSVVTREVMLRLAGYVEELNVTATPEDQQLMTAFTHQLSSDQVAALPEDPEELALVLRHLVGDDADVRVNGFSGGRLPPGTQIREIRIRYDGGAASSGGGPRVDITTTPGGDHWRNSVGVSVRDEAWSGRNAYTGGRPVGQTRQSSWGLNGPLARNRTGMSLNVDLSKSMENQTIRAATPAGLYSALVEQPSNRTGVWMRVEHQISPAQAIRVDFGQNINDAHNQGISEFDLPERAFTSKGSDGELRFGHHATFARRYVSDFRFALAWDSANASSISNARTIRVLDAFTRGGAQQQGGRGSRTLEVGNEVEFTARRRHRMTIGGRVEGSDYHGDEYINASGTYTFTSLASFESGQPTTFTRRVGDPTYAYSLYRFGWHIRDDYRARRNLMINLGLRHDFQTHMRDWVNFAPRIGVSWTPSSRARTVLRASMSVAYLPLDARTYQQTLLVDGLQQWDLLISSPGYPNPFSAGVEQATAPPSIIRARSDLEMPFNRRYTFGVDQPVGNLFRFRGTLAHQTGHNLFRSRNANAPANGIRPDPSVLNITELETTARSLNDSFQTDLTFSHPPSRLSASVNYVLGRAMSDTDGAFSLPPNSFDLAGEWGPARSDVRHGAEASLNSDLPGRIRVGAKFRAQSAPAYNITTGADPNGDGVYNERPDGVTRNSGRGASTKNLDLTLTWRLSLGQREAVEAPRGDGQKLPGNRGGGWSGRTPTVARDNDIFRFEVFARASNVLNVVNLQNFSGVLTSPFFGMPTSAATARRVVVGTRVWF